MILLDTNVISEILRQTPDEGVRNWLDHQAANTLFLSSITVAELLYGVAVMPEGRRKTALTDAVSDILDLFETRVLSFDIEAARRFATLAAAARAAGMGFPRPDSYIAAIAAAHGFQVASRDVAPFRAAGLAVIDPWAVS